MTKAELQRDLRLANKEIAELREQAERDRLDMIRYLERLTYQSKVLDAIKNETKRITEGVLAVRNGGAYPGTEKE